MSIPSSHGVAGVPEISGYRDLSPLGYGASSTVYRGIVDGTGNSVALKVLAGKPKNEAERLTFDRELGAMRSVAGHPYVVDLLDSGTTDDGRSFLAMPVYPHGTIGAMVEAEGPILWGDLLAAGIKLASAVESVHRSGFVHRDIKPANIFRSIDKQHPVLADFGVSSFVAPRLDGPATVAVAATPIFAAPEVLNGQRPTILSDIYALGTVLFGLLEGRPAYAHQSIEMIVQQVASANPVPTITADAPPELRKLIARMMAKRPIARPPTALGVAQELAAIQRGHGLEPTAILILTDEVLEEAPSMPRTVAANADRRLPDRETSSASTIDLDVLLNDGTLASQSGPPPELPSSGGEHGAASLTEQETVTVYSFDPPTRPLQAPRPPPRMESGVQPTMRWPIVVGLITLAAFVLSWVVFGRSLVGGADEVVSAESDQQVVALEQTDERAAHDSLVGTLAWSEDGRYLFTAGRDGHGQLWVPDAAWRLGQADTAAEVLVDGWILAAAWSDSGLLAVGSSGGQVTIWDPSHDTPLVSFVASAGTVEALDWRPGSNELAIAGGDGSVGVWALADSAVAPGPMFPSQPSAVIALAWSPDGTELAAGGKDDQVVVWNTGSGDEVLVLDHVDWVRDLAWTPTGAELIVAVGSGEMTVWDRATHKRLHATSFDSDPVAGVEWLPSAQLALTGTEDGRLLIWPVGFDEPQLVALADGAVTSVAWSRAAKALAVGRVDGSITVWVIAEIAQP